jgi:hypothetical protein
MAGESTSELKEIYEGIRAEAKQLAGGPYDVPQRAAVLHTIYLDSGRNHVFPQVALHGALWAYGFFAVTGLPGRLISYRYFYDREERAHRSQMLHQFSVGFQKANRAVFVDTYANYYLTKHHGERTGADELVKTELLEALNRLHYAARSGKLLGRRERGDLYEKALLWEQEKTVGPRVRQEIESFDCPILTSLVLRPAVHFNYSPRLRYLFFKNFGDTKERIEKAILSYELAEKYGWDTVVDTMKYYGVLPPAFFQDPVAYAHTLPEE